MLFCVSFMYVNSGKHARNVFPLPDHHSVAREDDFNIEPYFNFAATKEAKARVSEMRALPTLLIWAQNH